MRTVVQRISSPYLLAYVAAVDAIVWLGAFPFDLYCKSLLARTHPATATLLLILLANVVVLALMASSVVTTGEILRRGITRTARRRLLRRPAPALVPVRSRRSGY